MTRTDLAQEIFKTLAEPTFSACSEADARDNRPMLDLPPCIAPARFGDADAALPRVDHVQEIQTPQSLTADRPDRRR